MIHQHPQSGCRLGGDPTRCVEGIATGIGFLGSGSIRRSGSAVEGITTAAGTWVVGAVGIACASGALPVAILTVLLTCIISGLIVVPPTR